MTTQNNYKRKQAEATSGQRHFFDSSNPNIQVMSARADTHFPGVKMQRTMFLINDERVAYPVVVDVYRLESEEEHQYDYPVHFTGQLMMTNFDFETNVTTQNPLGSNFGYQHIWDEGKSGTLDETAQVTWMNGQRYYTVSTIASSDIEILFGRIGANDPNFNLRSEPMFVSRTKATDCVFASIIEPHGYSDEAQEKSTQAKPVIQDVQIIGHNSEGTVVDVKGLNGLHWQLCISNDTPSDSQRKSLKFADTEFSWKGNYQVVLK